MSGRRLLVFGLGYSAGRLAARLAGEGWVVTGTTRDGRDGTLRFDDAGAVRPALAASSHILASIPPDDEAGDPVLTHYGDGLAGKWLGYLSSTGVYGDAGGGWVDETAPTGTGRRSARAAADADWLARGAHVFRLPGIYGPGRSPLDRVRAGTAHRTDADNLFSRIHVDDIVSGVIAGFDAPPGAYNLTDDHPVSPNTVTEYAAALLGMPVPPVRPVEALPRMARGFYAERRLVANGKAKRVLGWTPAYPDYRAGLRAVSATTSPAPASAAPAAASGAQR